MKATLYILLFFIAPILLASCDNPPTTSRIEVVKDTVDNTEDSIDALRLAELQRMTSVKIDFFVRMKHCSDSVREAVFSIDSNTTNVFKISWSDHKFTFNKNYSHIEDKPADKWGTGWSHTEESDYHTMTGQLSPNSRMIDTLSLSRDYDYYFKWQHGDKKERESYSISSKGIGFMGYNNDSIIYYVSQAGNRQFLSDAYYHRYISGGGYSSDISLCQPITDSLHGPILRVIFYK